MTRLGILRFESDCLLEIADPKFVVVIPEYRDVAQNAIGLGKIGIEGDRQTCCRSRSLVTVLRRQHAIFHHEVVDGGEVSLGGGEARSRLAHAQQELLGLTQAVGGALLPEVMGIEVELAHVRRKIVRPDDPGSVTLPPGRQPDREPTANCEPACQEPASIDPARSTAGMPPRFNGPGFSPVAGP